MAVGVDEPGDRCEPLGVDGLGGVALDVARLDDLVALYGEASLVSLLAGAFHDGGVLD